MQVRCPLCHHPVEVVDEKLLDTVACPACGTDFSLVSTDRTVTHVLRPKRLAHFELTEQLGCGGFGEVWKARDKLLDRIVALKVPRRGQLDAAETEFFFRDARAAAQLRHPNIVSVHEVGRDGETIFIASDFIEGANLKEWLSARKLTVLEAAQLVAEISEALQHAHEHGVVHRDLKPANILMDPEGHPHVTDFGLAKRESGEVTMTVDGQILGTPAYMSPEQARGKAHEASAATDVYSLGVILFELLTGEIPFRGEKRMLILQILNDDPPQPRKLNSRVSRDMQTICLKCLEKEPPRRYQSARALADELRRVLRGEPIQARPAGHVERLWRWCKRQPMVASLSAAVLLSLVAGTVISACFAWNESVQRQQAVASKRIADKRLQFANKAVSELLIEVGTETLRDEPQMEGVRAVLLEKALQLYESISATSSTFDEANRHETAIANFQVGQIQRTLGKGDRAETAYREAIEQLNALSRDFPAHVAYRLELALCHSWLGELLREAYRTKRSDEAEQHCIEAIKILSDLAKDVADKQQSQYQFELARSHMNRGIILKDRGLDFKVGKQTVDAQKLFEQAKADYDRAESLLSELIGRPLQSADQYEEFRVLLSRTHLNRGVLLKLQLDKDNLDQQLFESAKLAYVHAIEQLNTVLEENRREGQPDRLEYSLDFAKYHNNLAILLMEFEENDPQHEAPKYNTAAVDLGKELNVGPSSARKELANFYHTKAVFLNENKETEQAIAAWQSAIDVLLTVWHETHDDGVAELAGKYLCNNCIYYQGLDKHEEAIQCIDRLSELTCRRSRLETAAKYMDQGQEKVKDRNPALAERYQQRARSFREKSLAAK